MTDAQIKQSPKSRNFLWPKLETVEDAQKAIRDAFWLGVFLCSVQFIMSFFPIVGFSIMGNGFFTLGDVSLIAFLLVGLHRKSRVCAVLFFAYYFLSKAYTILHMSGSGIAFFVIFSLCFLNGARGVFAYYKLSGEKPKGFRWQTILWVLSWIVLFFGINIGAHWAEEALFTKKLRPVQELMKQEKYDEAMELTNKILKPYGSHDAASELKNTLNTSLDRLKLQKQGLKKIEENGFELVKEAKNPQEASNKNPKNLLAAKAPEQAIYDYEDENVRITLKRAYIKNASLTNTKYDVERRLFFLFHVEVVSKTKMISWFPRSISMFDNFQNSIYVREFPAQTLYGRKGQTTLPDGRLRPGDKGTILFYADELPLENAERFKLSVSPEDLGNESTAVFEFPKSFIQLEDEGV